MQQLRFSLFFCIFLLVLSLAVTTGPARAAGDGPAIGPQESLALLQEGNRRFVSGELHRPHRDASRRIQTSLAGQAPVAVVLACSDSRVPVELLFDLGVGDLFVVRVAGNVPTPGVLGSIEYAVEHLNVPLVLVLGHTDCGAVRAACAADGAHGIHGALSELLAPLFSEARSLEAGPDLAERLTRANVRRGTAAVREACPELARRVAAGDVLVLGGVYDIASGAVTLLEAGAR